MMTIATHSHIIHPEWVAQNFDLPQVRILDARLPEFYTDGHIPNAVSVNMNDFRHEQDGIEGMLISPDKFAQLAGALGIGDDTRVIIYDDYHGLVATRIAWSFLRYGHKTVAVLDGGWDGWEAGEYPISDKIPAVTPHIFTPHLADVLYAELDYVEQHLNDTDTIILDVRSVEEYRKGYIPSAVFWDWQNATSDDGLFGDLATLHADLLALGVTPDKEIITYCQSGVRASHTFFLLHQLGYKNIRVYDGSWLEWSTKKAK
jgi:thiosulfate/3-mercaptopyruvate sulfurtransferase